MKETLQALLPKQNLTLTQAQLDTFERFGTALEEKNKVLQKQLCNNENMSDYQLLSKLNLEQKEVAERLAAAYDEWAEAGEGQI